MHRLANICYVCLEKDKLLSDINSSLSVNKDIIHKIGYLPFNLTWLKTLQIILICEECCIRLRDMYQFMEKCLKNSALLKSYMDNINTSPISNTENEAELLVKLNITHKDMSEVKSEIQLEDEEIYKFQFKPNTEKIENEFVDFEDSLIKEGVICKKEVDDQQEYPTDNNFTEIIKQTEDVVVNLEDYFVKEETTWKREEVDDSHEYPTDNNSTENMNNESDSEISVSDDAHLTNTSCVRSGFTCKQAHAIKKNDLNTARKKSYKCSTCSKTFIAKSALKLHSLIHTDRKSYECATCKKCFSLKEYLVRHMRTHSGEKLYECFECTKCFSHRSHLVRHMRIHTGEKPYECSKCKKCFNQHTNLVSHMRIHTGDKPYECSECKQCFANHVSLMYHMRIHTDEKPYECSTCKKCFRNSSNLVSHMWTHTGEKPYECSNCKKYFKRHSHLIRHMRIHTDEKP